MNKKLTVIITILATALIFAGTNQAFAAEKPTTKVLTIAPTSVENIHTVLFQVCAGDAVNMRAPEVIVTSFAEVKTVHLSKVISMGTCTTTATQIQAFDPANIKIKVINKAKLNTMIDNAEKKLIKIKSNIALQNNNLQELLNTIPGNTPTKVVEISKLNEIGSNLVDLRKELRDARSEYYRLLYVLKGS